jgi:hypothetical protein
MNKRPNLIFKPFIDIYKLRKKLKTMGEKEHNNLRSIGHV